MSKEIIIPADEITDINEVTQYNIRKFQEHGLDIKRHEVEELIDDPDKGVRVLKVKTTKYFT